jgi:hypothetical protein
MRIGAVVPSLLAVSLGLVAAGGGRYRRFERPSPEEAILRRRIEGLRGLIEAARRPPLVRFDQMLVVIDAGLVGGLLRAATPVERVLQGRYRIVLDQARVEFEDGFALVKLGGRVSLATNAGTFADIDVYGGLDVVGLDPSSGILRARVKVVAFEVRRVDFKGLTAPLARLVEDVGRAKLSDFEGLLSKLEIPIRLDSEIAIPGVGPEGGVRIPPLNLPLHVAVVDVKVLRGKLWISVGASASPTPTGGAHVEERR